MADRTCMTCRFRDMSGEMPDDEHPVICRASSADNFPVRAYGAGHMGLSFARSFVCGLWAIDRRVKRKR